MTLLSQLIPTDTDVLALEPEELAGALLEVLLSYPDHDQNWCRNNFFNSNVGIQGYPPRHGDEIKSALMEAWVWLEREGLLMPRVGDAYGLWSVPSRRARRLKDRAGYESFRKANLLPRVALHPQIASKVESLFLRGDYDTAVFQAFKEVEVAVRAAAVLAANDVGVALMRRAFDVQTGRLTDMSQLPAERQALSDLFAGAIGTYKNPQSHRNVGISDGAEAAELLLLANHLLRVVESRAGNGKAQR